MLSACETSAEFPAESGCKANELTRYKVDTLVAFYLIFNRSIHTSDDQEYLL